MKKQKNTKQIFKKILSAIVLLTITFFLIFSVSCSSSCSYGLNQIGESPNNNTLIPNEETDDPLEEKTDIPDDDKESEVVATVIKKYDGFIYLKSTDGEFIITSDAKKTEITDFDLTEKIYFGTYFKFYEGSFCGVKNVFGKIVVNAEYLNLSIYGETILCENQSSLVVIKSGVEISRVSKSDYTGILLVSDNYFYFDGKYYDLHFNISKTDGLLILSDKNADGWVIIKDETSNYFGFKNLLTGEKITPKYSAVDNFIGTCAKVTELTFDYTGIISKNYLINKQGNKIADLNASENLVWSNDNYILIKRGGLYLLYDSSFNFSYSFEQIWGERVYGNYVVLSETDIMNIEDGNITVCDSIFIADNGCLIIKNGKYYDFVDGNMELLFAGAEDIICCGNAVLIKSNGAYALFDYFDLRNASA